MTKIKTIKFQKSKRPVILGFFQGINSVKESFSFFKQNKGFSKFFIIPFFINIIILGLLIFLAYHFIYPVFISHIPSGSNWYFSLFEKVAGTIFLLLTLLIIIISYSITGYILCCGFYDFISQKTEIYEKGKLEEEDFSLKLLFHDIKRALFNCIKFIGFSIIVLAILFLFNFIPIIGTILYTVFSGIYITFFLGFELFDIMLERKKYTFKHKLKVLLHFKWPVCGIGFSFLLLSHIPILGFLTFGFGIIASTLFFIKTIEPLLEIEYTE